MGKSVIVVGPDKHLGGLSAGGLGWTDSGNKEVIGGISREFYQRVRKYYDKPETWKWQKPEEYKRYRPGDDAQWTFEPHLAEKVFEDLVREYKIPVIIGSGRTTKSPFGPLSAAGGFTPAGLIGEALELAVADAGAVGPRIGAPPTRRSTSGRTCAQDPR